MSEKNEIPGLVTGLIAIIAAASFFILGFTIGKWEIIWLVFLAVPVTAIITDIAAKKQDVLGSIVGLIALLATATFFVLGFGFGEWHPGWVVFLIIPVVAIIFDIVKKKDLSGAVVGLVAVLCAAAFMLIGSFVKHSWQIAWVIFLLIPMTAIIVNIFKAAKENGANDKEKDKTE